MGMYYTTLQTILQVQYSPGKELAPKHPTLRYCDIIIAVLANLLFQFFSIKYNFVFALF